MVQIDSQPTIIVNESLLERINGIKEIAREYGLEDEIVKYLTINHSSNQIGYTLAAPKILFKEHPGFQMKLNEAGFSEATNLDMVVLTSYSYHGFHLDNPKADFIRFDFEPFKKKYAPVHINAPKKVWGDHLTYPDSTNLDISKMSCGVALKVFKRYAKDKGDYPTNPVTNSEYIKFFEE